MAIGSAVKRTDAHSQASALSEKDHQGTLEGFCTRKTSLGLSQFWRFWTPRALPWQIWAVVMACVCLPGYENATPATPLQMTPGQLVRAVRESVVLIRTLGIGQKSEADLAGDPPECQNAPSGGGTGFVIAATGYILTNDHVAAPCPQAWPNVPLKVYLSSGEAFDAMLVGRDPATELTRPSTVATRVAPC
jgi:S1-C subfamily serine protease